MLLVKRKYYICNILLTKIKSMRKVILSLLLVAFVFSVNAQEKGKIRVGFSGGLTLPNSGFGLGGDMDIRYNVMDNVNVGVKFGSAIMFKDVILDEVTNTASLKACGLTSTLVISDYYFSDGLSVFAPFIGGGLGLFKVLNLGLTAQQNTTNYYSSTDFAGVLPERKFGGMLRGGFEAGHFRMSLEYYLVPRSTVVDVNNLSMGMARNSFLNATIGFYLGGGRWRKL